jgi:CRP-like cAMP-binding protein
MVLHHEQVLRDKIDMLNAGSVENRVFELLNHLIRRFGKQESHLQHFIPIRLTRAQIGKLVDVRVETIIRLISRWQKQKLIVWKETGILIENLPLLEKSLSKNRRLK